MFKVERSDALLAVIRSLENVLFEIYSPIYFSYLKTYLEVLRYN